MDKHRKRQKNQFFCQKAQQDLEMIKGFVVMCDRGKQKNAINDMYNLLNDRVDQLQIDVTPVRLPTQNFNQNDAQQIHTEDQIDSGEKVEIQNQIIPNTHTDEETQKTQSVVEQTEIQQVETVKPPVQNVEQPLPPIVTEESEEKIQTETKKQELPKPAIATIKPKELDTLSALEQEIGQMSQRQEQFFYSIDPGVKCMVIIKINNLYDIDPYEICESLMNDVHVQKETISRYIHRIIPSDCIFSIDEEKYKRELQRIVKERVPTDRCVKWVTNFQVRNNNKYSKQKTIDMIKPFMERHIVDYKNPDYVVNVEIVNQYAAISVLEKYVQYHKYSSKVQTLGSKVDDGDHNSENEAQDNNQNEDVQQNNNQGQINVEKGEENPTDVKQVVSQDTKISEKEILRFMNQQKQIQEDQEVDLL